jgi:O-antigen/teichoic acid export membrane protein
MLLSSLIKLGLIKRGIDERSFRLVKSISSTFLIKALSIAATFFLIPVSINLLNPSIYGAWLTISATISWVSVFDVGLSNGLRNKVAECLAKGDLEKGRIYVSVTYFFISIIIGILLASGLISAYYLDWNSIFNTDYNPVELKYVMYIVIAGFFLQFLLRPISSVLQAAQLNYQVGMIQFIGNFLCLLFFILFPAIFNNSLLFIASVQVMLPVIILLVYSFIYFNGRFKSISPSFSGLKFKEAKGLIGMSGNFFLIQIFGIILFSSTNFIISSLLNNEMVTEYNILTRYYSVFSIGLSIIAGNYWSAFTNAFTLRDKEWIQANVRKLEMIALAGVLFVLIQLILSNTFINWWIGNKTDYSGTLNVLVVLSVALNFFNIIYTSVNNGNGKITWQMWYSGICAVFHIPLSYLMVRTFNFHLEGIVLVNIIWQLSGILVLKTHYKKTMAAW